MFEDQVDEERLAGRPVPVERLPSDAGRVASIMFVLLFAYVFGGAIKGSLPHGVKYIDFLLPGILVQSVAFRATQRGHPRVFVPLCVWRYRRMS